MSEQAIGHFSGLMLVREHEGKPEILLIHYIPIPGRGKGYGSTTKIAGGKREGDESPRATAVREAYAETGYTVAEEHLVCVYDDKKPDDNDKDRTFLRFFFIASKFTGEMHDRAVEEESGTRVIPFWCSPGISLLQAIHPSHKEPLLEGIRVAAKTSPLFQDLAKRFGL